MYHLNNIRTLLTEGFTDSELRRFCYDHPDFRPVYDELSGVTGKNAIIDVLLEYANRKELLEPLLEWAQKKAAAKYDKFKPYREGEQAGSALTVPPSWLQTSQLPGKSYRELVGRDMLVGEVMAALRDPAGKWMVAIDGMGGIGKTALAREVADHCLSERLFEAVVWEQAPKEHVAGGDRERGRGGLTYETVLDSIARQLGVLDVPGLKGSEKEAQVRALLQMRRILVVLDNLETAGEPQNEIARRLRPLLNLSKALLTSRHRFQGDLYMLHLTGLDGDSVLRFIRQEAEEKGINRVAAARAGELREIAQCTGGSPLALKLVIGQLGHLPLETVLKQLREVQLPEDETDEGDYVRFYKGIFFPSWKLLSDNGKRLLISMTHFAPGTGGTLEAVQATSKLADDVLSRSIDELWRLSFLEVGKSPSLKKIRYYLHALTQYFVLSDIVQVLK